ncbi:MAG TPA: response regulator [Thermodesulfobacteriota bacterium]|nr:response regulator [Thermodesulfobacteriota bacterium]
MSTADGVRAGRMETDGAAATVLVIEPEPGMRELLAYELGQEGFDVVTTDSVAAAADLLRRRRADLVLADLVLPDGSQTDVAATLRAVDPRLDVIVANRYATLESAVALVGAPAGGLAAARRDRAVLARLVSRALEWRHLDREVRARNAETADRLSGEVEEEYQELKTLYAISQTILTSDDLTAALEAILDHALRVGPFDTGVIRLLDAARRTLDPVAHRGYRDPARVRRKHLDPHETTTGLTLRQVIADGTVRVVEDVAAAPGLRTFKAEGVRSAVIVPVRAGDEVLGTIDLGSRTPRRFKPAQAHLLEAIGGQMGLAVQKARLRAQREALEAELQRAQKLEAIGRLAGGIAHDFNNLLTAITGYTELLLRRLGGDDPVRRDLEQIAKAAERAASLTRQLLAFSRRQVLCPRLLDPATAVRNVAAMLERLVGEPIELVTCVEPDLGLVKADPAQLEQVLVNLALNARDAMPQGGRLTLEASSVTLDAARSGRDPALPPGRYVRLTVRDTGCGMDAETQAHLFEPFFTTKPLGKGTGLGLSVAYGIVTQSGGHIAVESAPGQGSAFSVYLPRADGADGEPAGRREARRGSETVLLVEDEEVVRQLVREVLQQHGYTVLEARQGEEALELARGYAEPIDLLVTDVVMPRIGGCELARRLAEARPSLKVLYVSGYTGNALTCGDTPVEELAFLQKPFTPQALLAKVREVLDGPAKPGA